MKPVQQIDHRTKQSDQISDHHSLMTTTDHHQNRPPKQTIRTDHHCQTRQPDQIRSPHQTTDQHPRTEQHTQPLEMVQVRCIHYGLGQGGI